MTEQIIWSNVLDNRYNCIVVRNSQHFGQLTIYDNQLNRYLLSKEVRLTYGAVFGPDAIDVSEWMGTIERVVDGVPDASVIEDWQNAPN
jgi:hypothetical protein